MIDKNRILRHINDHVNYPTTKKDLKDACNNMMDIPDEDKKLFAEKLPEGKYETPGEIIEALGIDLAAPAE